MVEINGELIHEMLKRISSIKFDVAGLKTETSNIRGIMVSMQMDIHNIYMRLDRTDARVGRIEDRLELRELAERGQAPFDLTD